MRILQLTPQFPYPKTDGGKIGIASIFESFSRLGHKVLMFSIVKDLPTEDDISVAENFGRTVQYQLDTENTPLLGLLNLFSLESTYISKHKSNQALEVLKSLFKDFKPDLVWADHTNMAWYGSKLKQIFKQQNMYDYALRLHNIEHVIWERYSRELEPGLKKAFIAYQAYKLKRDEGKALKNAEFIFPITSVDLQKAKNLCPWAKVFVMTAGVSTELLGYGVDSNHRKSTMATSKLNSSLVIGTNYTWIHNVNGLKWFVDNVLTELNTQDDKYSLFLIGKNPPKTLTDRDSVISTGFVDDFAEELSKYKIYIAPLLVGGGIRIKILEAMALGLPVVATSLSAEGIEASSEEGLFISDCPKEQANYIRMLNNNIQLYERMAANAKEYISVNHNWISLAETALNSIVQS